MKKLILVGLLLLGGCASNETISNQSYLLAESEQQPIASHSAPLLIVEVTIAPYLDTDGIIYRTSPTELVEARQHNWATDISDLVQARTIELLRENQTDYWPIDVDPALNLSNSQRLQVKLDRFNGSYSGNAEVAGEWTLLDKSGAIVKGAAFKQSVPLERDGYQALVSALSDGLNISVIKIAQQL